MFSNNSIIGLGIAGNFANHLEQAGELEDFKHIKTNEIHSPKGIFPFYLPKIDNFLSINPISDKLIIKPENENIQLEPEVAMVCNITYYEDKTIKNIVPIKFSAYNDCTIRKDNANKISEKKNWGQNSKGLSEQWLGIDEFNNQGVFENYNIVSFVKRDGKLIQYGDNCPITSYSYFYNKLINWVTDKLNHQKDFGPLENIYNFIKQSDYPKRVVLSIGSTSYTEFGQNNYLEKDDETFVILYDKNKHSLDEIKNNLNKPTYLLEHHISILHQKVISA